MHTDDFIGVDRRAAALPSPLSRTPDTAPAWHADRSHSLHTVRHRAVIARVAADECRSAAMRALKVLSSRTARPAVVTPVGTHRDTPSLRRETKTSTSSPQPVTARLTLRDRM